MPPRARRQPLLLCPSPRSPRRRRPPTCRCAAAAAAGGYRYTEKELLLLRKPLTAWDLRAAIANGDSTVIREGLGAIAAQQPLRIPITRLKLDTTPGLRRVARPS